VLYILDEPSIGLHQRDNAKLLQTLERLRDLGNTVIVVEHDEGTMRSADHIVDLGPGAGEHGGHLVAEGSPKQIEADPASLTGQYLAGQREIAVPEQRRKPRGELVVKGARQHNLKTIDVPIPLGVFCCVTGVSGSGKSTLINETLYPAVSNRLHQSKLRPGSHDRIDGTDQIDKIIAIDQSPIGRTPRSNPATYTNVFDHIRQLYAQTREARARGYKPGRFSFNVKGGRCEVCRGDGQIKIEMHFLPDVYVPCEQCHGKRYNRETLEVRFKGKSISDVLEMSVADACEFFKDIPKISRRLDTLQAVGLDYIRLGQPATQLSGGEAQRVKLATELSKAAVALAKSYTDNVEFSPMDATRADIDFTAEVCAIAVAEGATVINVPDTVGYTTPEEYAAYFRRLYELVPGLDKIEVSVHCHDDLGLAVANSFAGLLAGARQVECAVNGIGERAGNCSLEEIVMLLRTRRDEHGLDTGLDARELARTSRLVSRLTGYSVPPNKAVVGRNAFAHESGIHQDGVLKERSTYEIMDATEVGLESNQIVLGKHSGRHALQDALQQLGFKVEGGALNHAFKRFKEIADKKKQVTALDLEAIVSDEMRDTAQAYNLGWFEVEAGSQRQPEARVSVVLPSGEESVAQASGDGPVDAIFGAIRDATGTDAELQRFEVEAVTGGTDALGEVSVSVRANGKLANGQGVATDILEAAARAFVRAISNVLEGVAVREAEEATADAAVERTPGP
jgi:2-isopropylmalate synthase